MKQQCLLSILYALVLLAGIVGGAKAQSKLSACPQDQNQRYDNCFGTFLHSNGEKYIGEFKDDKRNGQGTFTWPDGEKYIGEWKDDKRNGQGTDTYSNGEKYIGEWKDDKPNGQGTQTTPNGKKYIGEFKDGKRNGQGTYTYANGEKYIGEWKDDKPNGQGTQTTPDGEKYIGEFKDGKRNGQGTYTYANGEKYIGEFKDGNSHGLGTLYASDGSVKRAGLWENAKFVRAMTVSNSPSQSQQQATVEPQPQQPAIQMAPTGKRVALIMGNARYKYGSSLKNAIRDAQLLASTLRNVGFQTVIIKTDLTREATIQTLRGFATIADSADWAVVYYAGYGIEFSGVNYIIPVDAQLKADRDIDLETVNIGQVLNMIEGAKRLRVVILDACRDNPFASQMRRTMASRSLGRGLARIEPEAGTLVVYAAKHGEISLDGTGNHSPFAEALVKRMQQRPGLEIRRLFDFVRDDVLASTQRKQQPYSYGSISASEGFYFVR
jgi:hypothetical protein